MQRKTRKDRQKQREDSTLDYQRKLGVKDKFNKRISCMSPDEYRSPRIKEFNSTGLQPTNDVSNRRSGEYDEVFASHKVNNNIKIIEDIGDLPRQYTSR